MRVISFITILFLSLTSLSQEMLIGEGRIYDAAFSPDGQFIVTASSIGLQTWDAETLTKEEFMRVPHGVRMIKWSPDGNYLFALQGYNGFYRFAPKENNHNHLMIKMSEFEVMYQFEEPVKYEEVCVGWHKFLKHPNFVNFSSDSSQIAFVTEDNRMVVNSSLNGNKLFEKQYDDDLTIVYFEDEDQSLVNDIEKIEIQSNATIGEGLGEDVHALSPDGKYLFRQSNETFLYPLDNSKVGEVRTQIYLREVESTQKIIKHRYTPVGAVCWATIPHRYGFFSEDIPFQFLIYYSSITWSVMKLSENLSTLAIINDYLDGNDSGYNYEKALTYFSSPFSPDGEYFLSVSHEIDEKELNLSSNLQVTSLEEESFEVFNETHFPFRQVMFVPDEEHLLFGLQVDNFNLYDRNFVAAYLEPSGNIVNSSNNIGQIGETATFSNDGRLFASSTRISEKIEIWDAEQWELVNLVQNYGTNGLWFINNNQLMIAGYDLNIVDIKTEEIINSISGSGNNDYRSEILSVDVINDNRILFSNDRGEIFEWDYQKNTHEKLNQILQDRIRFMKVLYLDHDRILIVMKDKVLELDLITNLMEEKFQLPPSMDQLTVELSPDKKFLLLENTIWNLETNQQVVKFATDMEPIVEMDISPDGEWLAASFLDGTLATWKFDDLISENSGIQNFNNYEN